MVILVINVVDQTIVNAQKIKLIKQIFDFKPKTTVVHHVHSLHKLRLCTPSNLWFFQALLEKTTDFKPKSEVFCALITSVFTI